LSSKRSQFSPARVTRTNEFLLLLAVIFSSLAIAIIPLLFNRNFYFIDDTQIGSTGPWHYLGEKILRLDLSLLAPELWAGGNWVTEGQFGLFSPITWLIAIFSLNFSSVWLYATIVKLFFIILVSIGTYKSARELNARPFFAILVGVAAPFSGFSSYFDQAAWFSGLALSAVCINYFWVSKIAERGQISSTVPILIAISGVAIGYVYVAIVLALITGAQLLSALIKRSMFIPQLASFLAVLLCSVAIYLPALLTAPVTLRSQQGLSDSGWFAPNLPGLLTNFLPVTSHLVPNYGPAQMPVPIMYGSILFCLFLLAKGSVVWEAIRKNLDVTIFLTVTLALLIGPSEFGPLRWPLRFYPIFIIFALLLLATSVGRLEQMNAQRPRKVYLIAFMCVAVFSWDQIAHIPMFFISNVLFLTLFIVLWVLILRLSKSKTGLKLAGIGLISMALVSTSQHFISPRTPLADYNMPDNIESYQAAAHLAEGKTMFIGGLLDKGTSGKYVWQSNLVGNAWMLSGKQVAKFNEFMGVNYRGEIAEQGLWRLFELEKFTGQPLADLMGLDTVVAFKSSISYVPVAPTNWELDQSHPKHIIYKRTGAATKQPFWVGWNANVSQFEVRNDSITFSYSTNDNKDAIFIFPRLAWPGYSASLGSVEPPTLGFLLSLKVPPGQNQRVTLEYKAPGSSTSTNLLVALGGILIASEALFQVKVRRTGSRRRNLNLVAPFGKNDSHLDDGSRTLSIVSRWKSIYSKEKARYVIFGFLNTVFGYLSFVVASLLFSNLLSPTLILSIGLCPSIVFAYTTQRIFIWRSKSNVRKEIPKFLLVTFAQFVLNAAVLETLVALQLGILFSQTLITILFPIVTYFVHKYWTFAELKRGKHFASTEEEKVL
jgi:putative flippase GtrA